MVTLVAVVVGGILAMLAQIVLDGLRTRAEKAARRDEIRAAVRAIRFHFYAAQHVLKAALESGLWWSGAAGLDLAAAENASPPWPACCPSTSGASTLPPGVACTAASSATTPACMDDWGAPRPGGPLTARTTMTRPGSEFSSLT